MSNGSPELVVVYADVEGAGPLWARDPDTMREALEVHDGLIRSRLALLDGGVPYPCGAGLCTLWADASAALRFCLAVQEGLSRATWPSALLEQPEASVVTSPGGTPLLAGLRVRMGVHVGEVRLRASALGGEEVVDGAAVRRAARIAGAARGGQVLVSEVARERAQAAGVGEVQWHDLGERRLRGVPGRLRLFDLRSTETAPRAFEAPRTRDVERTNLVPERDAFLGRDEDVAAIAELLELGVRVVSITGPEGVGRSRLARELVPRALGRWTRAEGGGVWVADCADATDVDDLLYAVSAALDVPLGGGRSAQDAVQQIARVLGGRGESVLVLDGLERWFEGAAAVLTAWLRRVPDLRVVLTAPDRVGAEGEVPYRLAPLSLPEEGHPMRSPAVRLLLRRARERSGARVGGQAEAAELVRAAGGLPLAIELLAGQVGVRPLEEITRDLAARVGPNASPGAHLRAVIDTCLTHLSTWERGALARLAVFPGAFDLEAAAVVANLGEWVAAPPVTDALHRLIERGFLGEVAVAEDPAAVRYRLHPAVRGHLRGLFSEVELDAAVARQARHVVEVAARWSGDVHGAHGPEALAALEELRPSLIGAFEYALRCAERDATWTRVALEAALALDPLLSRRGPLAAHEARLDRVLAAAAARVEVELMLRAWRARARLRYLRGAAELAREDLERARQVGRQAGDRAGEGIVTGALGQLQASLGQTAAARASLEEALVLLDGADARRDVATIRAALGSLLASAGNLRAAEAHLAAAARDFSAEGDHASEALALARLGAVRRRLGHHDAAQADLEQARLRYRASGDRRREADVVEQLGAVAQHRGDLATARRLLEEAARAARAVGDRVLSARASTRLGQVLMELEHPAEARALFHEALALARDAGAPGVEGLASAALAVSFHLEGAMARALEHYRRGLQLLAQDGEAREEGGLLGLFAGCHAALGDAPAAADVIGRMRDRARELEDPGLAWLADRVEAWVAVELGLALRDEPGPLAALAALEAVRQPTPLVRLLRHLVRERMARDTPRVPDGR